MAERQEKRFPDWAEQERTGDMGWIRENVHLFWPLAQQGYQQVGRGAIVVDTTITVPHPGGVGHLSGYVEQKTVEEIGNEETQRLVREYQPQGEFVATLLKTQDRVSSYRIAVIPAEHREDLSSRIE